jgi:hypothetical protein
MARTKYAAKIAKLHDRLVDVLDALSTSRGVSPTTARASVQHESLLIEVWSIRFQVANLELLAETSVIKRAELQSTVLAASREIAEHEKRLVVARKAIADDDEDEADDHDAEQAVLADRLLLLAGGR